VIDLTKQSTDRSTPEEDDDEDDEPVRKRRRTAKAKSVPLKSNQKNRTPSPKPRKEKATQSNGTPKNGEQGGDELPVRPSPKVKVEKQQTLKVNGTIALVERKSPAPEEEAEEEELEADEDDIKPEDAAKAREKVLTLLKGSGKDPYPDWKAGEPVPYAALCQTYHKIEMTTKRLEILAHCSLFLRQVMRLTPNDLLETVLLMVSKLGADYTGVELGIGESLIMKAIGESTGRSLPVIKADQNEIGDLGLVAAKSRSNQPTMFKPKALTIQAVFKGLKDIATIEGQGSQGRKVSGIKKLLSSADAAAASKGSKGVDITHEKGGPSEAKYIVRTLEGKLRLGLADKSVLVALAQAIVFHRTEYVAAKDGKKLKPPTPEALEKGESIMKSVYRFVIPSISH
jgi:DNA ligase-1